MKTDEKTEPIDLEAIKREIEFTELEDRLEMVQAAEADHERCIIFGNDTCKYPY